MGKLNLTTVLNQVAQENMGTPLNPYWGLRCNRGLWLTRFPLASMPEDPDFMMSFINAGGNLDGEGHYGSNPNTIRQFEQAGWRNEHIALFAKGVPQDLCGVEGLDETNWRVYRRGLERTEALDQMGIQLGCSIWTTGRKPLRWFLKKLFSKGFRLSKLEDYSGMPYRCSGYVVNHYAHYRPSIAVEEDSSSYQIKEGYQIKEALIVEGVVIWDLPSFLPEAFLAYIRRCLLREDHHRYATLPTTKLFSSLVAARAFCRKAKLGYYPRMTWGKWAIDGIKSSCGLIFWPHDSLLIRMIDGERSFHSVRVVAGFHACKIKATWFVWQDNISNHLEGQGSLRSVINLAERRRKRDSFILSLNDVRNDRPGTAGFCLAGTKGFLQNKMPFVYRMVAQYSNWAEIPEEIMSIEWHLATKDIFSGYSSPVN